MIEQDVLLVDLGNTRLKACALNQHPAGPQVLALAHADGDFEAQCRALLTSRAWSSIRAASVAAPALRLHFETLCAEAAPAAHVVHVHSPARFGRWQNGYTDSAQLGVDRFLSMLAAMDRWPQRAILLVSVGTALTVDALDAGGRHLGGVIAPAPDSMRTALASLLPHVDTAPTTIPVMTFAVDSSHAIASGCARAAVGLIEHCARDFNVTSPLIVLSGGGARAIAPLIRGDREVAELPFAVLQGLALHAEACP